MNPVHRYSLVLAFAVILASPSSARTPPSIWFESDSARLTAFHEMVMDSAASEIRALGFEEICIVGGTDRVGTTAYNLGLSRRRAEAVRTAIIRRGIPAHIIGIRADGESQPLFETEDGVADPNNRYAMILYGPEGCRSSS